MKVTDQFFVTSQPVLKHFSVKSCLFNQEKTHVANGVETRQESY
jgi:hypothetical protein